LAGCDSAQVGLTPSGQPPHDRRCLADRLRFTSQIDFFVPGVLSWPIQNQGLELSGGFRPDDLMGLFLYARDHCDGREPVTEIGDFVAHHNERDKGIVTRSTREWFAVARFHVSRFGPHGKPLDSRKMPPTTRDYFKIAVNRLDAKLIREKTGMRRVDAYKLLNDVAERLAQNVDGTWALPSNLTQPEVSLIEYVSSVMVVKPAFEADRLCDDFIATLKSNGLITKEELSEHREALGTLVQLYAVAAMHNCVVQIGDGTTTQLKASPEPDVKQIIVNAAVPDARPNQPPIFISSSMFTANVDPRIHCHADLLANRDWSLEIEVAQDKRLSPLR
jgi:hypothetical protein